MFKWRVALIEIVCLYFCNFRNTKSANLFLSHFKGNLANMSIYCILNVNTCMFATLQGGYKEMSSTWADQ